MPEQVTVIITETAPGGGSRFYQELGKPSSVNISSLTPNTEYRADAEYEAPDGTVIQSSNSMTFRTLPAGTFTISNPNWQNDNNGQHSTFTFDYTSTYALSYAQVVDMATGVTYQGTIVGTSVTAQLPAGTAGTQHNFQLIIADIYSYSYVQGYVMTLQASAAELPLYLELDDVSFPGTVSLNKTNSPTSLTMQTSYDNQTWSNYNFGDTISLDSIHPKVYFKNSSNTGFSTSSGYYSFSSSTGIKVGGNIASLKSNDLSDTTSQKRDFRYLFRNNTNLKNIDNLSLSNYTTLAALCYGNMFQGCTGLTTLPSGLLPATTLGHECYSGMFYGCTGLTTLPSGLLPATTLVQGCYSEMFNRCTGLTDIPSNLLPATTLAYHCYLQMFLRCTGLTSLPSGLLPARTLANGDYTEMFEGCTGLTSLPSGLLPATTLGTSCYNSMFYGCTGLTDIPSNLLPATTLTQYCYNSMFSGCTSLLSSPVLPATMLANGCYQGMFGGCSSLKEITCLAENRTATDCTKDWVTGVAATGTFYKSPNMSSWSTGASGIPSGWTVVDYQN